MVPPEAETVQNRQEAGENPEAGGTARKEALPPLWQERRRKTVWSIAGFDPSSGAGITADLMTFAAFGLFGCSAITAMTVQTTQGVFDSVPVSVEQLGETLRRLAEDLPAMGVKIGMLGSVEAARAVGEFLSRFDTKERGAKPLVVLDPVLRSSSGKALFPEQSLEELHSRLLPFVDWITPNWAELALLVAAPVETVEEADKAGRRLLRRHPHLKLVATGGDQKAPLDLVLVQADAAAEWLQGQRVETTSTHGTGCAFSSALLSALLLGAEPGQAARAAKRFVEGALRHAPGLGAGRGPMELLWPLLEGRGPASSGNA